MSTRRKQPRVGGGSDGRARRIAAGIFKARCLALMDQVGRTGEEIVITKRDRPVAMLVPIREPSRRLFVGRMRGTIRLVGDLVSPIGADWDVDADL